MSATVAGTLVRWSMRSKASETMDTGRAPSAVLLRTRLAA